MSDYGAEVRRVFLADGDALVLPTRRLLEVLGAIREHLPGVHRVSSYCLPRNLRKKSVAELRELADAGLALAYVGAESGDDEVLAKVSKGETYARTLDALNKLGEAGIRRSVMILNGLGGTRCRRQHADNSARLANAAQPEYLATLVVSFPQGEERFRAGFPGMAAAGHPRPAARDGALPVGPRTAAHRFPLRPCLELAGAQGHARRRQGAAAGEVREAIAHPDAAPLAAGLGPGTLTAVTVLRPDEAMEHGLVTLVQLGRRIVARPVPAEGSRRGVHQGDFLQGVASAASIAQRGQAASRRSRPARVAGVAPQPEAPPPAASMGTARSDRPCAPARRRRGRASWPPECDSAV